MGQNARNVLDVAHLLWLAGLWLLADLVGVSELVGYRPRGIHRPEPALG